MKLLPCPFCGNQPVKEHTGFSGRAMYIYCNTDDCLSPKAVGENEALAEASWNIRFPCEPVKAADAWLDEMVQPGSTEIAITRDDLAALSRCWNEKHCQPHGTDYRVNQWLKDCLERAV